MKLERNDTGIPLHDDGDRRVSSGKDAKEKKFSGIPVSESHDVVKYCSEAESLNNHHKGMLPEKPNKRHVSTASDDSGYISGSEKNDFKTSPENKSRVLAKPGVSVRERIESFEKKNQPAKTF